MSTPLTEQEVQGLLDQLGAPSAKRREVAARNALESGTREERIVGALQHLAWTDPYDYVRQAASDALKHIGAPVPPAIAPPKNRQTGIWVMVGIGIGALCVWWILAALVIGLADMSVGH